MLAGRVVRGRGERGSEEARKRGSEEARRARKRGREMHRISTPRLTGRSDELSAHNHPSGCAHRTSSPGSIHCRRWLSLARRIV